MKDALHVTSQNIEAEMAKMLKLAFEYTGEIIHVTLQRTNIITVLNLIQHMKKT